jgi:hypothetical protein
MQEQIKALDEIVSNYRSNSSARCVILLNFCCQSSLPASAADPDSPGPGRLWKCAINTLRLTCNTRLRNGG